MRKCIAAFCCLLWVAQSAAQMDFIASVDDQIQGISEIKNASDNYIFAFRQIGGLIFLKGKLGGTKQSFVLDTGAPTLILNSRKNNRFCRESRELVGIGGCAYASEQLVEEFSMGAYKAKPLDAISTDMSHLEKVMNHPIKGLIGLEAFSDYELLLNYNQQLVELIPQDGSSSQKYLEVVDFIPIESRGHFPVVKVKIGNRYYHFGVDSGAESNIINMRHKFRLRKQCTKKKVKKYLQGIDGNRSMVVSAKLHRMEVEGYQFEDMDIVFADISHLNDGTGTNLDGILGYPFLKSRIFSINFQGQYLALWDYLPEYKKRPRFKKKDRDLLAKKLALSE